MLATALICSNWIWCDMEFECYEFTHAGGRECNEDSVGHKQFPGGALYVLADGLGGHLFGDIASQRVLETLLNSAPPNSEKNSEEWLNILLENANANVLTLSSEKSSKMKSTVVTLLLRGSEAIWANVGDSRLYYLHNNEIVGITEDHSVAYRKYKAGEITREQIRNDADQPSLLRAIGNAERHAPSFYKTVEALQPGDAFLLCSDGLWEYLLDDEILIDFLKSEDAKSWGEALLLRVIDRVDTGHDNLSLISVIVK